MGKLICKKNQKLQISCQTTFKTPTYRQGKDLPVQRDDVVLPDHIVDSVDALVDVAAARGLAELVNKEITEGAQVGGQLLSANPLQNLRHVSVISTDTQKYGSPGSG